ncbi:MAG: hypothetical protein IJ600_04665 [Lachnospiraceae bacterium]|nr:hypothetical protein [Lachnospiraceae bacterium]
MSELKEFWGLMHVLDRADDVALFVVSGRDGKLLYCNHLVTVRTNAHVGSQVSEVWDIEDYQKACSRCNEGGAYRYIVEQSPFGTRKNVTVNKVVWSQGILAYSFLLTSHVDDHEEAEREKIFGLLGRSFRHIFILDVFHGEMTTLLKPNAKGSEGHYRTVYYHPVQYDEWRRNLITLYAHPDDAKQIGEALELSRILERLESGEYTFQYRRKNGDACLWSEMRFLRMEELDGKIVCTERDVDDEISLNQGEYQSEVILKSIGNVYRSIYLLDLETAEYTTVKPDMLLFGIPSEGDYATLMQIALELIPDEGQRKDFGSTFSTEVLAAVFSEDAENVAREYMSALNDQMSWVTVTAFRPPYMKGMENKCILTFMDITERKRVEAERNEKNIVIDALTSRYIGVFFVNIFDGTFHSIKVPAKYRYIEKQFTQIGDAMEHYAKAYVLEQYRDGFRNRISRERLLEQQEDQSKREYIYRSVSDQWLRLNIFPVPLEHGFNEVILAFEEYTDIMKE